jgi:hypothetical protein
MRTCGTRRVPWILISIAGVIVTCLGAALFAFVALFAPLCANEVLQTGLSPDGRLKAVVFERDCGATTDFSTQVSVLPAGEKLPNDGGNVFTADCDHGAAPSGPGGGPRVDIAWTGARSLIIWHHPKARFFGAEKRIVVRLGPFETAEVRVRYSTASGF